MTKDSLILLYDFSGVSSTIVPDLTGSGSAGVIRGADRGGAHLGRESVFGRSCPVLTLSGGNRGGYLQLPDGILNNKNGFSISFYCKLSALDNYGTICSFGVDHCFYLSVLPDPEDTAGFLLSFGATKGGRSQETALERWKHLPFDTWFHTVLTMDTCQPSHITLYLDGKKAGEASHRRMTALDLNDCRDCFFGFGSMSQNPLSLTLGEIRIFRECLSEDNVCSLFSVSDDARTKLDAEALSNFFPALVSADLSLPESGEFRSTIRWTSGTPWLVTDSGKIRRPAVGQEDGKASMQAEISYGAASRLCRFSFLVAAEPGPEALLREDVDSVVIPYALYLGSPPCLPVCGKNGSAFRWHSSRGDVFSPDSKSFLRPIGHPVSVTLTLEATLDRFRQEKTFSLRFWPVCPTLPGPVFSSAAVRPQKKNLSAPLRDEKTEAPPVPELRTEPVPFSGLSWNGASLFTENQKRCTDYLLFLDSDRMLYNFRRTYGQDTLGALPPGGWEEPAGLLRGHSTGHFLSALAYAYASTKDSAFREKAEAIIDELARLQQMSGGNPEDFRTRCTPANAAQSLWSRDPSVWGQGYLSAYPPDQFALLEQFTPYATIWAPYYTLHKLLAGFLDCAQFLKNTTALACAEGIAFWVCRRLSGLSEEHRNRMWSMYIAGEYGGMNESLALLARLTGNSVYLDAAKMFDNRKVFDGLSRNIDTIRGLHANQHIPQMIGALREFEASGDSWYYRIARNFWHLVTQHYMYSIGGVGRGENFKEPDLLAQNIEADRNCETCAAYNLLKLTGLLYRYEPDNSSYMDYYERTLLNQIAASQNPDITPRAHHGVTYMLPIGPGARREYSNDYEDFTCCHGTGMENHVRYLEHAWHHSPDESDVYLNLFLASVCRLKNAKTRITVQPGCARGSYTIDISGGGDFTLHIRIPYWCRGSFHISRNGQVFSPASAEDGYYTLHGPFRDGDRLQLDMPWRIHLCYTPDSIDGQRAASIMYGPLIMAALSDKQEWLTLRLPSDAGQAFQEDFPSSGIPGNGSPVLWYGSLKFVPMYRAHHTAYHTYFKIEPIS